MAPEGAGQTGRRRCGTQGAKCQAATQRVELDSRPLSHESIESGTHKTEAQRILYLLGSDRPVESDRRLIPVEHRPAQASATTLGRHLRNMCEELTPETAPAPLRLDVQIFQIETVRPEAVEKAGK